MDFCVVFLARVTIDTSDETENPPTETAQGN